MMIQKPKSASGPKLTNRTSVNQDPSNRRQQTSARFNSLVSATAVLIAFACHSATSFAEDLVAEVRGKYKVTIQQVLLQGVSTLDRTQGYVSVKLTFQNLTDASMPLHLSQMKAKCAERTVSVTAGRQNPFIPKTPITLKPKEVATGWLKFSVTHASPTEPELSLKFNIQDQVLDVSINDAIRKTSNCTWRAIGPNQMLGVISLKRPVDGFAVWVLTDTFKQLKNAGIQRVIVEFISVEDTWAVSSNSISVNSVDAWLQSATKSSQVNSRLPFASKVKSPVEFGMLHVVQPSTYRRPAYGFAAIRKPDLSSAIAASLRDVFQVIPADELEAAFTNPVAGIRRAAMETNLDRLHDDRLQQIFESATDDVDQLKLLAAELHRSASPLALHLLEDLARNENSDVSQAAMESIIKSASKAAVPAALALWKEFEGDADWETDFANAILKEDDYRFSVVLATYAERRLMSLTSTIEPSPDTETSAQRASLSDLELMVQRRNLRSNGSTQSSQRQINTLPRVLRFLRKQDDREFEDVAIRQLLKISDPAIQDDVLNYILDDNTTQIRKLVSDYIAQRLPKTPTAEGELTDEERRRLAQKYAPRGTTTSRRYSNQLFTTIKRFPKAQYTERLLELAEDNTLSSSSRSSAFTTAFHGATPQQIDSILEGFDGLTRIRRTQALNALMQLQHPRWLELAEVSLNVSPESAQDTLRLLQQDRSLEAALLMVRFLDKARIDSERKAIGNAATNEQFNRQVASFTSTLSQVNHPESQAYLNRLEKSPLIQFHNVGRQAKLRRIMSARGGQLRRQAELYRLEGSNSKAEEIYRQILESDPYDDSAMISLASLCMRSDRPKEAMELLLQARKVSPEDIETESFIALAMIRLGDVEGGLKLTEETLAEVPDLETPLRMNALYNTACAYSRASEKADSDEQRKQYVKKAFKFLHLSVDHELGFKEFDHALADPDLTVLHTESDWKIVINKMKVKAKEKPKD